MTRRFQSERAITNGTVATRRMLSRKKPAVGSCDPVATTDPSEARNESNATAAAMRKNRRFTREASSAAKSVNPWSRTVTTRVQASGGPAAMTMNVIASRRRTYPYW
jgi:hypothetical protein